MKSCEVCGNDYENSFEVKKDGISYWFDCFECATHKLAPECESCGVKVLGHGIEIEDQLFCCAHCARVYGVSDLIEHTDKVVTQ